MSYVKITQRFVRLSTLAITLLATSVGLLAAPQRDATDSSVEPRPGYRVLATNRTSTMERELNRVGEQGYRLQTVMGGETAFGGQEVVAIVGRPEASGDYTYRLLATMKTSTMQEELQEAAAAGFHYRAQTVFETAFGGEEVVVILERNEDAAIQPMEYRLLATSRTSTLESELQDAAKMGYELVGMTVGETSFGGQELVAITRRVIP